jgi:hypothetical protein
MPKKKVDNLQGFRIELQQSERDLLTNYAMGKTITNGVAAVAPVLSAMAGPLVAWWVAQWTAGEFKEFLDERVENVRALYAEGAPEQYNMFTTELSKYSWAQLWGDENTEDWNTNTSNSITSLIGGSTADPKNARGYAFWLWYTGDWRDGTMNPASSGGVAFDPKFDELRTKTLAFLETFGGQTQRNTAQRHGMTPAQAWLEFYPMGEVQNDAIYRMKTAGLLQQSGMLWTFITSPFRTVPDP